MPSSLAVWWSTWVEKKVNREKFQCCDDKSQHSRIFQSPTRRVGKYLRTDAPTYTDGPHPQHCHRRRPTTGKHPARSTWLPCAKLSCGSSWSETSRKSPRSPPQLLPDDCGCSQASAPALPYDDDGDRQPQACRHQWNVSFFILSITLFSLTRQHDPATSPHPTTFSPSLVRWRGGSDQPQPQQLTRPRLSGHGY